MTNGAGHQTASRPHSLIGDDGKEYIVKFLRDCGTNRTLANEQVTGAVAEALTVSNPTLAHVMVSADLIDKSPELRRLNIIAGPYLGCVRLQTAFDLNKALPGDLADKIVNLDDAAGALVLDVYVWNTDRNNAGNLLVKPTDAPHKYKLYVIDHGHCFGGTNWTDAALEVQAKQSYTLPTHPLLSACAARASSANAWLLRIEKLGIAELNEMVDQVPTDWNLAESSRKAMKTYLSERKSYTRRDCQARGVKCQ